MALADEVDGLLDKSVLATTVRVVDCKLDSILAELRTVLVREAGLAPANGSRASSPCLSAPTPS